MYVPTADVEYVIALPSSPGCELGHEGRRAGVSTVTEAVVGAVWVMVLGVTVSENVQVPLSPLASTSVPFREYVPTARYPLVLTMPL